MTSHTKKWKATKRVEIAKLAKAFKISKHSMYNLLNRNLPGYLLWYKNPIRPFKLFGEL